VESAPRAYRLKASNAAPSISTFSGAIPRAKPLWDYCLGLIMPCEPKSVERTAAIMATKQTAAQHQSLLHFVGERKWSDKRGLANMRELVQPKVLRQLCHCVLAADSANATFALSLA
jgi:SRSO17 transposase